MKRYLSVIFCLLPLSSFLYAQSIYTGDWNGKLNVGTGLHIVFHIVDAGNGTLSGTMDSPDQHAKDIKCSGVFILADSLHVKLGAAEYIGKLTDTSHLTGSWKQGGMTLALELRKGTPELKRPQTPKPPYGYQTEDIIYYNADHSQQFGATLTMPLGHSPFPAILLITGSGLENRDEEIFGHKPFAVLADYLTKKGYAVLRVDDRTIGESTGDVKNATTADFAKDVNLSLDYLKTRKEINVKKLGLLGHSEGGTIAPMVASQRKDIDFIILFAGVGENPAKLIVQQNVAVFESAGLSKEGSEKYGELYEQLLHIILQNKDKAEAEQKMGPVIDDWKAKNDQQLVLSTTGIHDTQSQQTFIDQLATQMSGTWFRYFLSINPDDYISKLSCKVLAINGSRDIQVISAPNLAAIKASLAKSKSKTYEVKELEGLNHLFQKCTKCSVSEYEDIEETIDPIALETIGNWLDKNVK